MPFTTVVGCGMVRVVVCLEDLKRRSTTSVFGTSGGLQGGKESRVWGQKSCGTTDMEFWVYMQLVKREEATTVGNLESSSERDESPIRSSVSVEKLCVQSRALRRRDIGRSRGWSKCHFCVLHVLDGRVGKGEPRRVDKKRGTD